MKADEAAALKESQGASPSEINEDAEVLALAVATSILPVSAYGVASG